jgi:hypothetical protein
MFQGAGAAIEDQQASAVSRFCWLLSDERFREVIVKVRGLHGLPL